MVGHQINRFINLSERDNLLICSICLNILNDAIRTECEHTFCKTCLKDCIEGNHKSCPECRQSYSRKRSAQIRDDPNVIIFSNYVFKRNLMANSFVDKLKTICDFESNGCQEVVEFGSLSAHLKECVHRLCSKCGFTLGTVEDHNCVELLINDRTRVQQKLNDSLNQISEYKEVVNSKELVIIDFKHEISNFESKLKQITDEEKTHKKERNDFELKYNLVLENNKQLEDQFSKQQQLVKSCEDFTQKNAKLKSELKSVSSQLKDNENETKNLKTNYKNVLENIKLMDRDLTEEASTCRQLRTDLKILSDKCLLLESKLVIVSKDRDFWRENNYNLFPRLKNKVSNMKSMDSTHLFTNLLNNKSSELQTEVETNEKTNNEWKDEYQKLWEIYNHLKSNDNNYEDINNYLSHMTQFDQQIDSEDIEAIYSATNERRQRSCAKLAKDLKILDKTYSFEEQMKKNNQIIENKNQLIANFRNEVQHYLSGLFVVSQRFCPSIKFIRFGTFITKVKRMSLTADSIELISIEPNESNVCFVKFDLAIPFALINYIGHLDDLKYHAIFIKLKPNSLKEVGDHLNSGNNSSNDYKFDVNSKDPKESYIVIAFGADSHTFDFFIRYLNSVEPPISFRQIDSHFNTECKTNIKTKL